jgi:hypothetical protein
MRLSIGSPAREESAFCSPPVFLGFRLANPGELPSLADEISPAMRTLLILLLTAIACGGGHSHAAEEAAAASPRSIVIGKDGAITTPVAQPRPTVEQPPATFTPRSIEELTGVTPETVETTPQPAPPPAVDWAPIVQAMQLMIDQQKVALKAMEQAREDSIQNSQRNSEAMEGKLTKLEDALAAQRTHEAETINRMNRLVVGVAAGFAGIGFVVMVLTAWFFMRTMNKVAEINAEIQSQLLALPHSQPHLVGEGGGANTSGNQRLLGALEQLERRIRELEHSGSSATGGSPTGSFDGGGDPSLGVEAELVDLESETTDGSPSVGALMAKGQTMLNLDDAEQALECFDAVLKQDPKNADALLKKGTALERLRRMQEALDAYDAALQQDDSLTMAYLAKGGICNRMERYAEALDCYERALRVQQQGSV